MVSEIRYKFAAPAAFTLTLTDLANGSARQATFVANGNSAPAALVYLKVQAGAVAPTAGSIVSCYLLRSDAVGTASTYRTDGAGSADAAFTPNRAPLLGNIPVTATASGYFYGDFDTATLGPLGPEWAVAVKNGSGQALGGTAGNFVAAYAYYVPEAQ